MQIKSLIFFFIKSIILFGIIYEYVPYFMPGTFLSSRKIGLVVLVLYYMVKGYSLNLFLKDHLLKNLIGLTCFCIVYSYILLYINGGKGDPIFVWYVYFLLYSLIGSVLLAGFFDWDYEKLLKAIVLVTVLQAIWCILTFYNDEFRLLNSALFKVSEDENIDFLDTQRLRSIGGAGAALSVRLALSSFSMLFLLLKRKNILLYGIPLLLSFFAAFLAGTTGFLVCLVSIGVTIFLLFKGRKTGFIYATLIVLSLFFLYNKAGVLFDDSQYNRLTEKIVSLIQNKENDSTVQALTKGQEVSGLTLSTLVGTGLSRGTVPSGEVCYHDGGYIRNYFGLGLIVALVFYFTLYRMMFKVSRGLSKPIRLLLLTYIISCIIIEYKEPFIFSYIPFFVFMILLLAERQQMIAQK